jgi:hypothetical protein
MTLDHTMTVQELKDWIEALEIECDGFEDGCSRLQEARSRLVNMMTYED